MIPKEGSEFFIDSWVVPKKAVNKENAEKWINFLCKAEVAAQNFDYLYYTTPNEAAYDLIDKEYLNNKAVFPGIQGGPLMHVIAAKAVCFKEALSEDFVEYQRQVLKNAKALSDGLLKRGVSIVSGGTDNHLMLVDLTPEDLSGKEVEKWLDMANITANKNTIPNDPRSPFVTSGIRLGSPSVTSRGMNEDDMDKVAEAIALVIKKKEAGIEEAKAIVKTLTEKYPLK